MHGELDGSARLQLDDDAALGRGEEARQRVAVRRTDRLVQYGVAVHGQREHARARDRELVRPAHLGGEGRAELHGGHAGGVDAGRELADPAGLGGAQRMLGQRLAIGGKEERPGGRGEWSEADAGFVAERVAHVDPLAAAQPPQRGDDLVGEDLRAAAAHDAASAAADPISATLRTPRSGSRPPSLRSRVNERAATSRARALPSAGAGRARGGASPSAPTRSARRSTRRTLSSTTLSGTRPCRTASTSRSPHGPYGPGIATSSPPRAAASVERVAVQSETTNPSKPHSPFRTPRRSAPCSVMVVPLVEL